MAYVGTYVCFGLKPTPPMPAVITTPLPPPHLLLTTTYQVWSWATPAKSYPTCWRHYMRATTHWFVATAMVVPTPLVLKLPTVGAGAAACIDPLRRYPVLQYVKDLLRLNPKVRLWVHVPNLVHRVRRQCGDLRVPREDARLLVCFRVACTSLMVLEHYGCPGYPNGTPACHARSVLASSPVEAQEPGSYAYAILLVRSTTQQQLHCLYHFASTGQGLSDQAGWCCRWLRNWRPSVLYVPFRIKLVARVHERVRMGRAYWRQLRGSSR